ncbi:hypothetical protein [Bradyrhizobium sp.]|uniref:hypothetical protein n=1 Tax=Bradyrhizobium sp. TaxID=376 RepID=UPI001DEF7A8D|nr:hypothetical protein [Bradyrhizobium sp.]MBV8697383.1 hypothetical protein [Bradyrhizobium sp.]MBV9984507.1 hypothetical protein [Bradyrhizobium sp.]
MRQLIAAAVVQKPIYPHDRLGDLIERHAPDIFAVTEVEGFTLHFDMPENSHKALCKGRLFFQIRRKPLN